ADAGYASLSRVFFPCCRALRHPPSFPTRRSSDLAIDLLVNNAGALEPERPLWEADPDEWWSVFETNVRGPFLFERYVLPGMLARDRKSTRLNSSHVKISYAVFCLKKKKTRDTHNT